MTITLKDLKKVIKHLYTDTRIYIYDKEGKQHEIDADIWRTVGGDCLILKLK